MSYDYFPPSPRYALLCGEFVDISDFAGLNPADRPVCQCPECGEDVTLKLGDIRTHHFAHKAGSDCSWDHESIEHLNAKLYLAIMLKNVTSFKPNISCKTAFRCGNRIASENMITGWDRVEVEFTIGKYRADIALLKGNDLLCVIEILVTHECTPDKIAYMDQYQIPWIEIRATDVKRMKNPPRYVVLKSVRYGQFEFATFVCKACVKRQEEIKQRDEEIRQRMEKEQEEQKEWWEYEKKRRALEDIAITVMRRKYRIWRLGIEWCKLPEDFVEVIRQYKPALEAVETMNDEEVCEYLIGLWEEAKENERKSILDDPWWEFRQNS